MEAVEEEEWEDLDDFLLPDELEEEAAEDSTEDGRRDLDMAGGAELNNLLQDAYVDET